MKKILSFCLMAFGAIGMMAQTAQMVPVDEKVRVGKLENGLTYYIRHNEEPKGQAAFYIAHKVGSVQEEENQRGLAHFLEHMAFNGSKHFPGGDVFSFISRIGVTNFNAETGWDMTYYHLDNAPVTNPLIVDSCMILLSDWSCGVQLTQSEIEKERDVIHGEYRMRDNANQRLITELSKEMYAGSRYAERMPIGIMEVIDNFSPEFLQDYYTKWYHPSLQAVIVVGDVDVDLIEGKIKTLFGEFKNPENEAPYELYPVPDNEQAIYAIGKDKEQQVLTLNYMFKRQMTPYEQRGTIDYLLLDYITTVCCEIINERLTDLSRKADCPFISAQVGDGKYLFSKTAEAFTVTVIPKAGQAKAASEAVMTEIARAKQHGFTASELERINEEYMSDIEQLYNNREKTSNGYFAQQYLNNFIECTPIPSIEVRYALFKQIIGKLDAEMFRNVLNSKTPSTEQNFVAMVMCPENDAPSKEDLKAGVDAGFNAQTEALADEGNNEPFISVLPKPVKIKKEEQAPFGFTKWSLKNGANVYFRKTDFSDDRIVMNAFSKGGFAKLTDEFAPLQATFYNPNSGQEFSLFDLMVSETGINKFTASQLRKKLAGKNVSLSPELQDEIEVIDGSSTIKDLRTFFELVYLVFQGPSNDPDGYNSLAEQIKAVMPQLDAMHSVIQRDSVYNTVYMHNPNVQMLHASTLDKTDYSAVQKALADRYNAAGDFDFVFAGPIDVDSLRAYVEQYIAPMPTVKKRETFSKVRREYVKGIVDNTYPCKMPNADASESVIDVRWTADVPSIDYKMIVSTEALGVILSDRMFQKIREEGSMGYHAGASAYASPSVNPILRVKTNAYVKPERKDEALAIMYKELENIANDGVTPDEIKKYVEPTLTGHLQGQRNDMYWVYALRTMELYNIDTNTNKEEIIKNVSSDDIKAIAAQVLKANNRTTVVMVPEIE